MKREGENLLWNYAYKMEDIIKMADNITMAIKRNNMGSYRLDCEKWRFLFKEVMNFRGWTQQEVIYWRTEEVAAFQDALCNTELLSFSKTNHFSKFACLTTVYPIFNIKWWAKVAQSLYRLTTHSSAREQNPDCVMKLSVPLPVQTNRAGHPASCTTGRLQLKGDGTRWRTGEEVKGKLANAVGSQYPSHYLGTWCIQHYYRWCAHLGCQQSTELTPTGRFKWTRPFRTKDDIWFLRMWHHISTGH